jgi:hypothetical protein
LQSGSDAGGRHRLATPIELTPKPTAVKRNTKLAVARRYIGNNYPKGIPAGVTDKEILRHTGVSERTVRRARQP